MCSSSSSPGLRTLPKLSAPRSYELRGQLLSNGSLYSGVSLNPVSDKCDLSSAPGDLFATQILFSWAWLVSTMGGWEGQGIRDSSCLAPHDALLILAL